MDTHKCSHFSQFQMSSGHSICLHTIYSYMQKTNQLENSLIYKENDPNTNESICIKVLYQSLCYHCFVIKPIQTEIKTLIMLVKPRTIVFDGVAELIITLEEFCEKIKQLSCPYFFDKDNNRINFSNQENDLILKLFSTSTIREIYNDPIITENALFEIFESIRQKIYKNGDELSLISKNYKYYYSNHTCTSSIEQKYVHSEERKRFELDMTTDILSSLFQTIYLTGPSGIGKSISLLFFQANHENTCYFNCKCLINLLKEHKYKDFFDIIIVEVMHLYQSFNEFRECYLYISKLNIKDQSFWGIIEQVIKYTSKSQNIVQIYIFDQYKEKHDKNNSGLQMIKSVIKNNFKIKVIISSSINDRDIGPQIKNYWRKSAEQKECCEIFEYFPKLFTIDEKEKSAIINKKVQIILEDYNYLPRYFYEISSIKSLETIGILYTNSKDNIKQKIKEFYNNDSFNCFRYLAKISNLIGKALTENEFMNIVDNIPLKYITVTQTTTKEGIEYQLEYSFHLVETVISKEIDDCLTNIYREGITNEKINYIDGIMFEKLVTHAIINNKIFVPINQVIEVDSVIDLREKKEYEQSKLNKKNTKPLCEIEITPIKAPTFFKQFLQSARHYDGAILMEEHNNEYTLILIQITLCKDSQKRITDPMLKDDFKIIKKNFESKYNITIQSDNCFLYYIFCKERPDRVTEEYCQVNNYNYVEFSLMRQCIEPKIQFPLNKVKNINRITSLQNCFPIINDLANFAEEIYQSNVLRMKRKRNVKSELLEKILEYNSKLKKLYHNKDFIFLDTNSGFKLALPSTEKGVIIIEYDGKAFITKDDPIYIYDLNKEEEVRHEEILDYLSEYQKYKGIKTLYFFQTVDEN